MLGHAGRSDRRTPDAGCSAWRSRCVPLVIGWQLAALRSALLAVGFLLGIAGASFAVALPLASRWYPPQYQGLAMGIAGAGNSGIVLATLVRAADSPSASAGRTRSA